MRTINTEDNENRVIYFPELKRLKYENKYGLYKVSLIKDNNVLTGYSWRYDYYEEGTNKVKRFSSYDLVKLRKLVEENNMDWIVTDIKLARESYALNERLQKKHDAIVEENRKGQDFYPRKVSSSGVQYVYLNKNKDDYYWTYRDKVHRTVSRKLLSDLHSIITDLGYSWTVKDKDLYESIINGEVELDNMLDS